MIPSLLETFYMTAKAGSFQKASEQLFVSSTALIKQINQLEKNTGLTLFRRTNKGLELTDSGKIFFDASEKILHDYYDALQKAQNVNEKQQHVVRIGISQINPFRSFSDVFNCSPKFFSFIARVVPISAEYKEFTEHLRTLGADVDIIPYFCGHEGLSAVCQTHCLARLPLRVQVPEQHPLAGKKMLTYDDLNGQDIVTISSDANRFYREINADVMRHAPGAKLHPCNYYDFLTINYAVHSNRLMLVGDYLGQAHPQMHPHPVNWDLTLPYGIHYAKNPSETVSAVIQAFIDSGIDGTPENAPIVEL